MRTNLSSQISLNRVSPKYYKPENAVERSVLTRCEKVPTDIYETMEEGVQHIANEITAKIQERQREGKFCVIGAGTGASLRPLYAELVRKHKDEGLSFRNVVIFNLYEYYGEDKAEVYWIHFTGSNVKNILRQYGFQDKERVFQVGTSNEYEQIFKRIIIELQRCQDNYEEMLVLLLRHLLISFHRELTREHILKNEYLDHEMDNAVTFFSENYNQNINIDDYAASRGMSVSWFIRNFKKYTGSTPMQFIVGIRINNAQMLLETTTYSINEISKIVGYDNQLYFSRLFHKLKGYSPREYRKLRNKF